MITCKKQTIWLTSCNVTPRRNTAKVKIQATKFGSDDYKEVALRQILRWMSRNGSKHKQPEVCRTQMIQAQG